MKFKIVGKNFEVPVIEAENADDAIIDFATNMDLDMNLYFKAIPADNANDLKEREEELDEPELIFTYENENEPRIYYDLANFLTEFADGNFFTSDKISNVEVYGKAQNLRLNITSMFELACILDAEDKYHFRGTASSYSCDPTGSHVMHDKSYYLNKFKDKYAKCEEEVRNEAWQEGVEYDSSYAQERFDEDCNAEEIVGYYINYDGDDALKTWRENIEGRVITDEIRDVTRILEYLYDSETYALSAQDILSVLVASMPKDSSEFNSQYHGEPNHLMNLPNGRTLKIIAGDSSAEEANYTWVVVGSEIEQSSNPSNNLDCRYFGEREYILAIETSDDLEYDTVYSELEWAIRIAAETPKYEPVKPKFTVGDEVRYTKTDVFCYVVKVPDDGGIRLYDTCNDNVIILGDDDLDSLILEGHSEMAEKVFS